MTVDGSTPAVPAVAAPVGRLAPLWAYSARHHLMLVIAAIVLVVTGIALSVGAVVQEHEYWLVAVPGYITGIGTLVLAGVTVWIAQTDRQRDDQRASEARADTEKRITGEWDRRRGELQRGYAIEMIKAVEDIKIALPTLVEASSEVTPAVLTARKALRQLQTVTRTDAVLCGEPEVLDRFIKLTDLCVSLGAQQVDAPTDATQERLEGDLITYCVHTVLGVQQWASYEKLTSAQAPTPVLFRNNAGPAIWTPPEIPPVWNSLVRQEPLHPFYIMNRPAYRPKGG